MKFLAILALYSFPAALAFSSVKCNNPSTSKSALHASRRDVIATATASMLALPSVVNAAAAVQDSLGIDEFLRTGVDGGGNMGVSSQAGKSRPQTGVVFRDGTDVLQSKKGDVSAEILVGTKADPKSVLISFTAPYKLETGSVYDVECRDQKTGDGAFLAVTEKTDGKSLEDLDSSFFMKRLFDPTGRFSFYGPPTDVKVKKSTMVDGIDSLRTALVVATIPKGTDNAVMLVASANASRWKKGANVASKTIVDSFSAIPSPKTSMKLRAKDRTNGASIDF
ncbi:hypothetical protein QTG54_004365 [Skeletonema marinoi]|uniref:Photosystem II reaction center Psb28 protein n=1 Tax=Skeletonema marinoi TaxID=267567 RepID=A0AAD8YEL2_9STRA|nr:hypothetical protein QTG54_004365 [Skeletonema marinoi]